jgi:LPS-assembly lipoprotein
LSSARNRTGLAALAAVLGLGGCGFHPLYGSGGKGGDPTASRLDQVEIGYLANRDGQLLHQALEADLERAGAPSYYRYHLAVSYGISVDFIGIQPDTSNTRDRYHAHAHWKLTQAGDHGKVLTQGDAEATDGVNVIENQYFASRLDNSRMQHVLAREIARQITTQLAIWLDDHPDSHSDADSHSDSHSDSGAARG